MAQQRGQLSQAILWRHSGHSPPQSGHRQRRIRSFSTIPIFLGFFWMLWDPEKRTWHDKIAGAVVVPAADYR